MNRVLFSARSLLPRFLTIILALWVLATATAIDQVEAVTGPWDWYGGEVLDPSELRGREAQRTVTLPLTYLASEGPQQVTLRTEIYLPRTEKPYGLKVRYLGAAYRVYVNGTLIAEAGSVEEPIRAQYLPAEAFFVSSPGHNEIVINVAGGRHRRVRLTEIEIGPGPAIQRETILATIKDSLLFGSLFLLAAYHFILFFISRRDRASLFFAMIAMTAALRVGITTERILVRLWPSMPAELMMKIGFAPVFLLLPLFVLYAYELHLFPSLAVLRRPALWFSAAATLLLLVTPVRVYDTVFQYGLPLIGIAAIYTLWRIVSTPTTKNRDGIIILFVGTTIILLAALNDYLREIDLIYTPEMLSVGILFFLVLQAHFLAWRFRDSYRRADLLAAEVQTLNTDLEHRIEVRTRELAQANERLETLSKTDVLTGLANRRYFNEVYEREWHHAARDGRPLAAIMLDVDRFKRYNDHYGHLAGDTTLHSIARILGGSIHRKTDLVARFGGEEFVVLLPDTDQDTALSIAEGIRIGILDLHIEHEGSPEAGYVTASLGVASRTPRTVEPPLELLNEADRHLYRAKQLGRNRVVGGSAHSDQEERE